MRSAGTLCEMNCTITIILIFLSTLGFSQREDSLLAIVENTLIDSLNNPQKQKDFLQVMFDLDQEIRNSVSTVEQTFGNSSSQYDSIVYKWKRIDRTLFNLIIEYLNQHDHPKLEMGEIACYTPQLIFHHVSGTKEDIKLKQDFFPMFYRAYKDGAVKDIYFYLFRLHSQIKHSTYTSELNEDEKIEELIDILDLKKE